MEIKQETVNKVVLSAEFNGKVYEMSCPMDASVGELHDVLLSMKGVMVDRMMAAQKEEKEVTDFVNNKTDEPPEFVKPEELKEEEPKEAE